MTPIAQRCQKQRTGCRWYCCGFRVIVGTGTGAGIVVHGKVLTGANAIAGEWGHNPLPWSEPAELPGKACYCGKHGCIETWLSGTGFQSG